MNNEETLSPQLSLQIISQMIEKTKDNLRHNSFYFLLWGWLVFVAAAAQFILLQFELASPKDSSIVWNLMWAGVIGSIIYSIKKQRKKYVRSYIEETMRYFGISLGILYASIAFIFGRYELWQFAFPVYILLYAVASFFMGSVMRFRLLQWGGITCLPLMIVSVYVGFQWQLLLLALAVLIGYIIPGHLLHKKGA